MSTRVTCHSCNAVWQLTENSQKTVDVTLRESGENPYDIAILMNVALTGRDVAWTKYLVSLHNSG
jgi:hypothetical protein